MIRRLFIGLVTLSACSVLAQRAVVEREGSGKIAINLSGYRTGNDAASRTFLNVLKADLNRSGYFTVTSGGGAVNLAGQCVAGGSQMQADCQVFNAATRERYLGKTYKADANDARIGEYAERRDFPAMAGPSLLSVHLRFGTISIRELVRTAIALDADAKARGGAAVWDIPISDRVYSPVIRRAHPELDAMRDMAE